MSSINLHSLEAVDSSQSEAVSPRDLRYQQTLQDWLFLLENRHQEEIQLGLERVKTVALRLGLCDLEAVVITVAGTNGKGSTVAALDAIYNAAGYRVGRYTSPHLLSFNERICINQMPITDAALCEAFQVIEEARGDIHLTYFEMTTLAAFYYFKKNGLDVVILEVGMGGRLDATNIIDASLAIITTIDLDHQDYLGSTIEDIGYEKAGILRADQPFIYADMNPPVSILKEAQRLRVQMSFLGDYSYQTSVDQFNVVLHSGEVISLPCPAIHLNAAAAAIVASDILKDALPITHQHQKNAMKGVHLTGRRQIVKGPVTTLLDVAHNPQAVRLLADFIRTYPCNGKIHAVFSGLKDKDLCGLIKPMLSVVDFWYLTTLQGKRAASQSTLLAAFNTETHSMTDCFGAPEIAYESAMQKACPGDIIVVYGSFLTVSAVMLTTGIGQEAFQ